MKDIINSDLIKERKNCSFNIEELAEWWHGGKQKLREKRYIENLFLKDPEFENKVPLHYLSPKEYYEESVRQSTQIIQKFRKLKAENKDGIMENLKLEDLFDKNIIPNFPFHVHYVMFIPGIMNLGTPEQQDEWLEKATKCQIIGTYVQTELGHGTFVRGLETKADFDSKTDEFVLNSPNLTSYKWWPGALAHSTNYAIVMAQLYIDGKCHGVQPFIVQLRNMDTHLPLPGIDIGSIGSKLGMPAVDNGFLGFKNVRIPRTNMLMKNARVLRDGTFIKPKTSVLTYVTMTYVRTAIVHIETVYLKHAVTVATRYSAVRRQSPIDTTKPEVQVIDHVTQQLKIFPEIARTLIFSMTAKSIGNIFTKVSAELNEGKLDRLSELHALSCCLKVISSSDCSRGIENLRLACGGHGYMSCSSFPLLYGQATAACTYEGENTVLLLQTARYLLKMWISVLKGQQLPPTIGYLSVAKENYKFKEWEVSIEFIIKAFQIATANKIRLAFEHLEERKNQGYSQEEANNLTGIELTSAADLYGRTYLLSSSFSQIKLECMNLSPAIGNILMLLLELYAIEQFFFKMGDILRFVFFNEMQINDLQVRLEKLLDQIRSSAVGIVDSFDIPDRILNSALGAYDGNVYERIFEEAKKSPLNQEPVNKSFHLYLKPFMKSNL